jgi:hypothetical protein
VSTTLARERACGLISSAKRIDSIFCRYGNNLQFSKAEFPGIGFSGCRLPAVCLPVACRLLPKNEAIGDDMRRVVRRFLQI